MPVEISHRINIQSINGGLVHYFKLPSDCKIITGFGATTDIFHLIKTSDFPLTYRSILRNFAKNLKNIYLGNLSLQINNACDNLIFDYPVFLTQKVKFGLRTGRDADFDIIIETPGALIIDVLNEYKMNSMCRLSFKYNDILQEISSQWILPDGESMYKNLQDKFNLILLFRYRND